MKATLTWREVVTWAKSKRARDWLTVWTVVLLISGQGVRYAVGLPGYGVLCVLTFAAVAMSFRASRKRLKVPFLIAAFVGLAGLSVLWSQTRVISLLAVIVLAATTYVAIATVRGSGAVQFMALLYRGLQVSLVAGVLFELMVAFIIRTAVFPWVGDLSRIAGTDSPAFPVKWSHNLLMEGGPIQGLVGNRNPFGAIALLAAILAVVLLLEKRINRLDGLMTVAIAAAVHLLTMSATVTVSAVYVVGLALAALAIRHAREPFKRILSFSTLAVTAVAGVLTIKFREDIFALVDRGSDATNRVDLWSQVVHYAEQRPEGWGFVGYWPVWEEPYASILARVGLITGHGHNAYLDTWFQMGIVGLVLLLVIVALLFGSAWRLVERASTGDTYIPVGWALLTAVIVLQGLTESRMLVEGGWYLLVVLYCSGPQVFRLTIVDPALVHYGVPPESETDDVPAAKA